MHVLKILVEDNGSGVDHEGLQAFFNLGNSPDIRRIARTDFIAGGSGPIDEKGMGQRCISAVQKLLSIPMARARHIRQFSMNRMKVSATAKIPEVVVEECEANAGRNFQRRSLSGGTTTIKLNCLTTIA
jgi:hypothetical protein